MTNSRLFAAAFAVAMCAGLLSACAPIVVAGAAAGATLMVTDPRSAGAQVDDTAIETKVASEANGRWGDRIHLNATSYNGIVLLTGEAPDRATYDDIAAMVKSIDRVRSVQDEMVIAPNTPLSSRTNDTYITSKVKTRFIEANKFPATWVKVVTERQVVYLMGMVTRQQGEEAAQIAANTSDVKRVVKVFEYAGT